MPAINPILSAEDRRKLYEDEIKRQDHIIVTSTDLNEVYYAYKQKQEYERLLGRNKGA